MQRLLVVVLAAFDAIIAVAAGVAVALAPLTLLWVFGIGDPAWQALWPASGTVWQLGHFVPLSIQLPGEYLAATGMSADAASFTLSLTPLAFAAFTAIFAARSGARAARAGAWVTGVGTGTLVVAALAAVIGLTSSNPIAAAQVWQAVLLPTAVYALPALSGALVTAWCEGDGGLVDRLHDRVDALPGTWALVPGLIARGGAVAVTGLVGAGALAVVAALVVRGGDVIALFETGHVDVLGATVITLGQLAYLPTLIVWAIAFLAGPGFALGTGTAVSPAGTQLSVVPAIPLLGAVPEVTSTWLLAIAVVPIVIGGVAGWAVRGRVADTGGAGSGPDRDSGSPDAAAVPVPPALVGLIPDREPERMPEPEPELARPAKPVGALSVIAVGIALIGAGGAALLAFLASGSLGPGRLAEVGPAAGPVALAVGVEILIGAAIVLLTTRTAKRKPKPERKPKRDSTKRRRALEQPAEHAPIEASGALLDELRARVEQDDGAEAPSEADLDEPEVVTAPIALPDPATLGRHRPAPLPPVD